MTGASIKTTLELWASSLREVKARIRPLFSQERVAASAGAFLDGLLGPEQRKTGGSARSQPGIRAVASAGGSGTRSLGCRCPARCGSGLRHGNIGR